jgi:hypothetical protein
VTWMTTRILDGAKRNPGPLVVDAMIPDCASLHPGYATGFRVRAKMRAPE